MNLNNAVIVAYGRSAIARAGKKGALRQMHPVDIAGLTLKGILDEKLPQFNRDLIEDVILGCAIPEGKQGLNPARLVAARAGLSDSVCGLTVDRFCSSGLQAIAIAATQIQCGMSDVLVAGGVESMTALPMTIDRSGDVNPWLIENRPGHYAPMGVTAENVAARYGISREEMDAFAVESHKKAAIAQEEGRFDKEIVALMGVDDEGNEILFNKDQGIRKGSTVESLAALKPCFKKEGTVTAATSSQVSDGASFVVMMSEAKAQELGLKPIAKLVGFTVAGCDPDYMGLGPIEAVPKLMDKVGMSVEDMDVIELNEAFASQAIACIRDLKLDSAKVNPNGGAIALGHPMGCTGAFLTCKALNELERIDGKYAMVTMCIGGGMGAAGIFERV